MPDFILRRNSVVRVYPHDFDVILILQDGFELRAGKIAEQTGAKMQVYWAWGALPSSHGRSETRDEAMAAFRKAWEGVTLEQIAAARREQEWTANKYALWDAGFKDKLGKGQIRCRCGAEFDPSIHEETMAHIAHIKATPLHLRG